MNRVIDSPQDLSVQFGFDCADILVGARLLNPTAIAGDQAHLVRFSDLNMYL